MIPTQLYLEPGQEKRIMKAFRSKKGCQIKARKGAAATHYHGEMLLTPQQWLKYQKATNGKTIRIPFEHKHLVENMNHKGGFLPLIAAALAPVIGGIAGGLIERKIAGSGIGKGMYLNPYTKKGKGMYLNPYYKKGKGMYLNPYKPHRK